MNNKLSIFNSQVVEQASKRIKELYPDNKVMNNIIISNNSRKNIEINIIGESAKRSIYENISVENSEISRNAFCGTVFNDVIFKNNRINGNSFISSNFYKFVLESNKLFEYEANNFSNSYFNSCSFKNAKFVSSTWLNSNVVSSNFNDCVIQSCTMEGTIFNHCKFNNVTMSSANLDYMIFKNTTLNNVVFPFYQFAYIIGINVYLNSNSSTISFRANEQNISLEDFKSNINDLICYYYELGEYFPVSNLLIAIGNIEEAKRFIVLGVKTAFCRNDYRMVKHYCKLCKYSDLQTYDLTKSIKQEVDNYLFNLKANNPRVLNEALIQTAEISTLLEERTSNKLSLNFEIQTNIDRLDINSQEKINKLIGDCKYIINNEAFNNDGHTLTEISYCPTSLIFSIIGNAAALITIGMALQQFVVYIKTKKSKNTRKIAKEICNTYSNADVVDLDTKVEL